MPKLLFGLVLLLALVAHAQQPVPELRYDPPPNFYHSAIHPPEDFAANEFNAGLQVYPFRPFNGNIEQLFQASLLREWIDPRFQERNVAGAPAFGRVAIRGAQTTLTAQFVESSGRQHMRMVVVAGNMAAIVDASASSLQTWQRAVAPLNQFSASLRVEAGTPVPSVAEGPGPAGAKVAGLYMGSKQKYLVDLNKPVGYGRYVAAFHYYVNVIVAGKQPEPQWLDMDSAIKHCAAGIGIWHWAGNDGGGEPDVVMACCGDVPTLETLAAVDILRRQIPDLKMRVVNVVDLMTLQPQKEHPHGLSDRDFDLLFTRDKPVIFAFHGYPWLIHRLTCRRTNHDQIHVRGFKEKGTTTTPFDMVVLNDLDRFHLAADVIERVPGLGERATLVLQILRAELLNHKGYIEKHGEDLPEIRNWKWGGRSGSSSP